MKEFNIGDRVTTSLQSPSFPRREATVVAKEMRQFAGQLNPRYQVHFDGHATRVDTWVIGACLTAAPAQTKAGTPPATNGDTAMQSFKFNIDQGVTIKISGEKGAVLGRAAYGTRPNQYWVHYKAADGRAVSDWFDEAQLADTDTVDTTGAES